MRSYIKRLACFASLLLAGSLLHGCFSVMSYQTADTLPKGGVEYAMGWSTTKIDSLEVTDDNGNISEFEESDELGFIPNVFPDIMMRFGLGEDTDIGFKLHFMGLQGDAKFRLVHTPTFSMALAPGISYSRPLFIFNEYGVDLPILFTIRLSDSFSFYGGLKGRFSGWNLALVAQNSGGTSEEQNLYTFAVGGHVGMSFGGKRWFIRPEVGYLHYVLGFNGPCEGGVKIGLLSIGLGFGFHFGVEDDEQTEKIERLEKRLDNLEEKKQPGPEAQENTTKPAGSEKEAIRKRADESFEDLKKEEEKREE
ncbi:MAG: hypothetical protein JRF33_08715 [Deltaproteobacteria bacterium]|nr:hypothetical protein [Deltaproteobacteria bacterium]